MVQPDTVQRFLTKGRLVYIKDGEADWGWGIVTSRVNETLKVFLPVYSEDGPAGQVVDFVFSQALLKVSKVCTKVPDNCEDVAAQGAVLNILTKVKDHPKFVNGIPELDPIKEMNIAAEVAGPLLQAIQSLEKRVAQ